MMGEDGYTLKEVIEKNFTDLKVDMKAGFQEIKSDAKEIRKTAEDAYDQAAAANKRIDSYDRHLWLLWATVVGVLAKIVFDYFSKGG